MSGEAANQPTFVVNGDAITPSYPGGYQEQYQKIDNGRYVLVQTTDSSGNLVSR